MDKIEKIKEWVKKRKKEELARNSIGVITGKALFVDANELLSFLDTLSEEPDKSLEEEVKNYFQGYWPGTETAEQCNTDLHFTPLAILRLARHFAEWQKKKDDEEQAELFTIVALDAAQRAKEQMMKEAMEGFIFQSEDYYPKELIARYDGELKHGDKVRIIVLPIDDEK